MRKLTILSIAVLLAVLSALALYSCQSQSPGVSSTKTTEEIAVKLAEKFPKDFPLIEGKIVSSMEYGSVTSKDGSPVGTTLYTQIKTPKTIRQAMEFYKPKFRKITREQPIKNKTAMYSGFIKTYPTTIYVSDKDDYVLMTVMINVK